MKIAIFGGSFNPVHNEHIKIAKSAVKELGLDKLVVMPTYQSPHKKGDEILDAYHRLNMLKLAFNFEDKIEVSSYEIDKKGVSYTFETILHFKSLYKNSILYFIMGSDMLENFPTWKNPQIIVDNCNLVLIERRNGEFDDGVLISKINNLFNAKVIKLKVYGEDLSSSKVRVYNKLGLDLSELIPDSVNNYIVNNSLFQGDKYYSYIKNALPIKRKVHTAGVILTSIKLAKKLGVSKEKAELASLLHDIAKYKNPSDYKDFFIEDKVNSDVVHQFLGEYIARTELCVDDGEILNAIKYHTTGRANMTMLEKIVYIADLIEPSRKFLGVETLREEIEKDFDKGFKICLLEIVEFLKKNDKEIYKLTLDALKEN